MSSNDEDSCYRQWHIPPVKKNRPLLDWVNILINASKLINHSKMEKSVNEIQK